MDISNYIIEKRKYVLQRPRMYAANPESLEDNLQFMEEILEIIKNANITLADLPYCVYLRKNNYGSASYCGRMKLDNPNITDEELWDGLVAFWKEYLKTKNET